MPAAVLLSACSAGHSCRPAQLAFKRGFSGTYVSQFPWYHCIYIFPKSRPGFCGLQEFLEGHFVSLQLKECIFTHTTNNLKKCSSVFKIAFLPFWILSLSERQTLFTQALKSYCWFLGWFVFCCCSQWRLSVLDAVMFFSRVGDHLVL